MYIIWGTYRGNAEEIDSFESRQEARKMLAEYQMAFGSEWSFRIRRETG